MIEIIKAEDRHFNDFGWLQTYWLFSFSDYYDPENVQFGPLRVFNDDVVAAGKGFPMHRHKEMEIITIILKGALTHEDDMGHSSANQTGDVQRMSAGTGVTHSEFNRSDQPLHLYQIWIEPWEQGLTPSYEQTHFEPQAWEGELLALASGQDIAGAVPFHADATIYRGAFKAGKFVTYAVEEGRKLFLYLTTGEIIVNGETLEEKDQARMEIEGPLEMEIQLDAELILIDLPSS